MIFPPFYRGVDQGGQKPYGQFHRDCEKIGKPANEGGWIEYGIWLRKLSDNVLDLPINDCSGNVKTIKDFNKKLIIWNTLYPQG